jgi:APA family basic amino acid/polyamine antiporter
LASATGKFLRTKSGLVRVMSSRDALFFNLITIQFFGGVIFTLQLAPFYFPQANIPLAFLLTIVFTAPLYIIYSVLSTAYPRSGGDYVFTSRLVSPMLGFVATFAAWVAWQWYFAAITPIQMMYEGLSPFFVKLAYYTGSSTISGISTWLLTPTADEIVGIIILAVSLIITAFGMSFYVKIQNVLIAFAFLAVALALGAMAFTTPGSYANSFNHFLAVSTGNNTDWYHDIINSAAASGYSGGGFSWYQTLGAMVLTMIPLGYGFWSIIVMGEIKDAKVLRLTTIAVYGSVIACGLFFTVMYIALQQMGSQFFNSFFFLFTNGGSPLIAKLPFTPNFVTLVLIGSNNSVFDLFLTLGVFLDLFTLMMVLYIVGTRVMFAQTLDRLLPSKFADLKTRYATPLYGLLFYFVGSVIFLTFAVYYPSIVFYTTASTAAVILAYILAAVAAILFPVKAKEVYQSSPISKYHIGRVPLLTFIALLSLAFQGMLIYFYAAIPSLGIFESIPLEGVIAMYVVLVVYYYINKFYQARRGIEISLAFKEVPPE